MLGQKRTTTSFANERTNEGKPTTREETKGEINMGISERNTNEPRRFWVFERDAGHE